MMNLPKLSLTIKKSLLSDYYRTVHKYYRVSNPIKLCSKIFPIEIQVIGNLVKITHKTESGLHYSTTTPIDNLNFYGMTKQLLKHKKPHYLPQQWLNINANTTTADPNRTLNYR